MTTVIPRPARREETRRKTQRRRQRRYGVLQIRMPERQAEIPAPPQEGFPMLQPPGLRWESLEAQISTNRETPPASDAIPTQDDALGLFISYAGATGKDRISSLLDLLKYTGDEAVQNPFLPIEEERFPVDELIDEWFVGLEDNADSAGIPTPSQSVVDEARRIVLGLRRLLPADTDVHTWDDGEVAVEVFGARGRGFLLLCESGGGALCVVTVDKVARRARYESSANLPDGFLREGLQEVLSLA